MTRQTRSKKGRVLEAYTKEAGHEHRLLRELLENFAKCWERSAGH